MFMRFIRPEDRRRSGGDGSGASTNWADTEPVCFPSEAFAEDLPEGSVGGPSGCPVMWAKPEKASATVP